MEEEFRARVPAAAHASLAAEYAKPSGEAALRQRQTCCARGESGTARARKCSAVRQQTPGWRYAQPPLTLTDAPRPPAVPSRLPQVE